MENIIKGAKIELANRDYAFYLEYTHRGRYKHADHTKLIAEKLIQVEAGLNKRLMFLLPPRHSKSMSVSETFASYFIGKDPNRRVILGSYGDSLARKFGRANKRKLERDGKDIFNIEIDNKNASVTNWGIKDYEGGMISAGIGSGITGEGADLLMIDDPVKNRQEADSLTYRNRIWNEWQNTLYTRLHPGGAVIIILTRWHEDDLAGRLLNPEYGEVEDWDIVKLSALAEEGDLLGRKEGEPLWPEHGFDRKWAIKTKSAIGSRAWNSLYQQRPSPEQGHIVNRAWWQFYSTLPEDLEEIIQSWDCSFNDTKDSSFVVGQVWGRKGADKYLIDQVRARLNFPATIRAMESLSIKHPQSRLKLIENKANGPAAISVLKNKIAGLVPYNPRGSKETRAHAASADIEAGNVYLPSGASWVDDYIEEWAVFPMGADDDQVDATSQAIDRLNIRPVRTKSYSGRGARA